MTDPGDRDRLNKRITALAHAVALHTARYSTGSTGDRGDSGVMHTAERLYGWLGGPNQLVITLGQPVDQTTGQPTGTPQGGPMKDSDKCPLIVKAFDAKQQLTTVGADVTFTVADTNVCTISDPDVDGIRWVIMGLPGSTVITGDWPDSPNGDLPGTVAVDVTPGDATSLVLSLGDPIHQ